MEVALMPFQLDTDREFSLKTFVVLSKAYKTLMDKAVKDMKQYDLSPSEFMILDLLYAKGKYPLQQIGEKILVTSGSITYNIDKLEKKGLLKRVHCEDDRRVIYAEITPAGQELFERIFPGHAELIHSLVDVLPLDEKKEIIHLLKKLGKGM